MIFNHKQEIHHQKEKSLKIAITQWTNLNEFMFTKLGAIWRLFYLCEYIIRSSFILLSMWQK